MATVKTYDSKCYDLAEAFLEDEPSLNNAVNRHNLALEIQAAIESEIQYMRDTCPLSSSVEADPK